MTDEDRANWIEVSLSSFAWEAEALQFIQDQFLTHEPYRAWSNSEFVADDGSLNEVDLLVFSKRGFFLVEIKNRPGLLTGDAHTWNWEHEGRRTATDNPIFLANRTAKRLASLLQSQRALDKTRLPFVEPLIFCSAEGLKCELQGNARFHVCLRDAPDRPGIMAALKNRECPGLRSIRIHHHHLDRLALLLRQTPVKQG